MSVKIEISCDWCRLPISDDEAFTSVNVEGRDGEEFHHYHALDCWEELRELLSFGREAREQFNLLPTCKEPPDPFAGARPVSELPIHPVAIDALRAAGIQTFADLAKLSKAEIAAVKGIGERRGEAIEQALLDHGLAASVLSGD